LDFETLGEIRFLPLERKRFACYDLALTAAEMGDNYPCALNGAGEVAVRAFLDGRIAFTEIAKTIKSALEQTERIKTESYEILKETDARARDYAQAFVHKYGK
jgi:1-deoxy-D-xylulose-5-phosphate reductoisomerase